MWVLPLSALGAGAGGGAICVLISHSFPGRTLRGARGVRYGHVLLLPGFSQVAPGHELFQGRAGGGVVGPEVTTVVSSLCPEKQPGCGESGRAGSLPVTRPPHQARWARCAGTREQAVHGQDRNTQPAPDSQQADSPATIPQRPHRPDRCPRAVHHLRI